MTVRWVCTLQDPLSPTLHPVKNIAIAIMWGLSRQKAAGHTVLTVLMSHVMQISAAPDAGQLPPLVPAPRAPHRVPATPTLTVTLQVPT